MTIDGVRVLAQETINESPVFVWIIAAFLVGCLVIFAIVVAISNKDWASTAFIISGSLVFLWMTIAGVGGVFNRPSDRYVYKCIFDEDVSIQEIYDEYEVVGRDGEIWILEDKE